MRLWPTRLAALVGVALVLAPAAAATADTADPTDTAPTDAELLLVLDASSSMAEPDADGAPRIDAAGTALHAMIEELAPEQAVGLRVFGGAVHEDRPDAQTCVDSELVVPVGTGNADALSQAVEAYAPLGDTPIAYALQQAAGDLSETGERTIVLVSDGVETCDPDPCEVARELRAGGLDLVIHTVGLGADDRTRSQLQCIAAAGGGEYFGASDAETLTTALGRLATRAFRPFVYSGTPVVGTPAPEGAPELAVGEYTDTIAETEGEPKHYTVLRSEPGSRLLVGVTMKNPSPSGVSAVDVRLRTTDDRLCGSATMPVTSIGGQSSFGSAGVATPVDGPAACTDDDGLVLSLGAGAGSQQILGETVQIVVEEIPPVVDADILPGPAASPERSGLTAGTPAGDVVGGVSPSAATPVEAGTTVAFDLVPGEIAFFSVPVDYGQGLEALVDFAGADGPLAEEMRPTSNALDVAIIAPHRAQVHDALAAAGGRQAPGGAGEHRAGAGGRRHARGALGQRRRERPRAGRRPRDHGLADLDARAAGAAAAHPDDERRRRGQRRARARRPGTGRGGAGGHRLAGVQRARGAALGGRRPVRRRTGRVVAGVAARRGRGAGRGRRRGAAATRPQRGLSLSGSAAPPPRRP